MTRRKPTSALSLVEVMIALTIIVTFVSFLFPLCVMSNRSVKNAQRTEIATNAASAALEETRYQGFDGLPAVASTATSVVTTFVPPSILPASTGQVTVTRVNDALAPTTVDEGFRKVEAKVSWAPGTAFAGSVILTTIMVKES